MLHKIDKKLLNKCFKLNGCSNTVYVTAYLKTREDLTKLIDCFKFDVVEYFDFIKAAILKIHPSNLSQLSIREDITYISSLPQVTSLIYKSKNFMNLDFFYNKKIFGKDVAVAVIDTGINPILDFCIPTNRILKFVDFINEKENPYDDNGHGTFVSSVLLGNGALSKGKYSGVAPKSKIVSLKALDKNGESTALQILKAMQWIFNNHEKYKIKVVCMSFGSEPLEKNDPLVLGVEQLWKKGITVVAAAGNSGPEFSSIKSPAISSKVITVGGLNDGRIGKIEPAEFSSRGPVGNIFKPDILAPAVEIVAASKNIINGKGYTIMSGTSVAAPMIAGVCALLYECFPNISPEQIKKFICNNAIKLCGSKNIEGYGMFRVDL